MNITSDEICNLNRYAKSSLDIEIWINLLYWIYGGERNSSVAESSGSYPPLWLGYLEENIYNVGHFQAIMPTDKGVPITPRESVLVTTSVSGVPIKNMTVSRHTLPSISSTSVPSPIHNSLKKKRGWL